LISPLEATVGAGTTHRWRPWLPTFAVGAFSLLLHFIVAPPFADDRYFAAAPGPETLLNWLHQRYLSWSPRLLIEAALVPLLDIPMVVWRLLGALVGLLMFLSLQDLLAPRPVAPTRWVLALLYCGLPFYFMSSAGWVTTSLNYFWPLALGIFALAGTRRALVGKKEPWYRIGLYLLALAFSASNEMLAVCWVLGYLAIVIWAMGQHRPVTLAAAQLTVAVAASAVALLAPGNALRVASETATWLPGFPEMGLFAQFRLALLSTSEHFVSVPNIPLFLFLMLLGVRVWQTNSQPMRRLVGLAPLAAFLGFTAFFGAGIVRSRTLGYLAPQIWPSGQARLLQDLGVLVVLCLAACVVAALWLSATSRTEFLVLLWILGIGSVSRLGMMFSPTVIASGTRTYYYFYVALLAATVLLWRRPLPHRVEVTALLLATGNVALVLLEVWVDRGGG
jgi:hypothetical protein